MSKQSDIREGIAEYVGLIHADEILEYLHSKDVMVRAEKECSHCEGKGFTDQVKNGNSTVCQICLGDRSIIEFESLIE